MKANIRPQIMAAILCGTLIAVVALVVGMRMSAVEVVTAVITGIFGFLAGVSFKVLESE